MNSAKTIDIQGVAAPQVSNWARIYRTFVRNRVAVAGLVFIITVLLPVAVFAPWVAPYDPIAQQVDKQLEAPSHTHPLGRDIYGRDLLSRIIHGARVSLSVGVASVGLGMILGVPLGLVAGFLGGRVDYWLTRVVDILMSFPTLLMGLMILAVLGPGMGKLILSIGISIMPRFARLARGPTISIREQEFVEAARALGLGNLRIMFRHILPNIFGDIAVMGALWVATAIRLEANLSFIGLGVQPPQPSWGEMIRTGVDYLINAPWCSIFPGLAILVTVLAFNMVGDGLRDIIDPKLR